MTAQQPVHLTPERVEEKQEPSQRVTKAAYVMEYGAVSLPLGHPSRLTCLEVYDTFSEAAAAAEACEFDARVFPIAIPDPADDESHSAELCALCGLSKHVAAHRPLLDGPNRGEPLDHAFAPIDGAAIDAARALKEMT